jgi:hypothetical protein
MSAPLEAGRAQSTNKEATSARPGPATRQQTGAPPPAQIGADSIIEENTGARAEHDIPPPPSAGASARALGAAEALEAPADGPPIPLGRGAPARAMPTAARRGRGRPTNTSPVTSKAVRKAAAAARQIAGAPAGPHRDKAAARRLIGTPRAAALDWTRDAPVEIHDDGDDHWFMEEADEDDLERRPQPPAGQTFPEAAAAGGPLGARRRAPTKFPWPPAARAPATTAFPAAPNPGLPTITPLTGFTSGLFEKQNTVSPPDEFASIRAPTAAELSAVSTTAIRLLFSDRRFAEITRPRNATDNVKAAAALKARRSLLGEGIQPGQTDPEHHAVYYGFQAVFGIGHSSMAAGDLLTWATPFGLDIPGDISKSTAWAAHLATAASLFPRLETAVFASRTPTREFPMPSSLFSQVRKLAYAYFSTRALALIPTLAVLDNSDIHEQAKTIIRAPRPSRPLGTP